MTPPPGTDLAVLDRPFAVIESRKCAPPVSSYTPKPFAQGKLGRAPGWERV